MTWRRFLVLVRGLNGDSVTALRLRHRRQPPTGNNNGHEAGMVSDPRQVEHELASFFGGAQRAAEQRARGRE